MSEHRVKAEASSSAIAFKDLPFARQKEHFFDVARRALKFWGYPGDAELKLLNITENATFSVSYPLMDTIVMRVHRLDYAEKDSIRTELAWIQDLALEAGIETVKPLAGSDGNLVQTVLSPELGEARHVVCFAFVPGKAPRDSHDDNEDIGKLTATLAHVPKWISLPLFRFGAWAYDRLGRLQGDKSSLSDADKAMYRKLGSIAGRIHEHAKTWKTPDYYQRIEWNWDSTFGKGWNNYYGAHYHDLKGRYLSKRDLRCIDAAADVLHSRLIAFGCDPSRYGMIHSDLRMSNLLVQDEHFTVLDFDDSGKGWFMYDLACIAGFMEHRPDLKTVMRHIVEGYRQSSSASDEEVAELPSFILMRRIGLSQAILYHLDNTAAGSGESAEICPEILAFYAKGTAILARRYLKEFARKSLPSSGGQGKPRTSSQTMPEAMTQKQPSGKEVYA